jgi:transposase
MARKIYDEAFKDEACRLVTEQKYAKSAVCRKLGVSAQALDDWLRKRRPPITPPQPMPDSPEALRARVRELEKQLARAEQEREILKKATAFFATLGERETKR